MVAPRASSTTNRDVVVTNLHSNPHQVQEGEARTNSRSHQEHQIAPRALAARTRRPHVQGSSTMTDIAPQAKPRRSLSAKLGLPSLKRVGSKKDGKSKLNVDQLTEQQLQTANALYEDSMKEMLSHMEAEVVANNTVDAIQTEVKVQREHKYKLERRATQDNLKREKRKLMHAQLRVVVVKAQQVLPKMLPTFLVAIMTLALFWLLFFEAAPKPLPEVRRQICLEDYCINLPEPMKLLERIRKL